MSIVVIGQSDDKPHSAVVICPADQREKAMAMAEFAMCGPLSPKGVEPATHYALQATMDEQAADVLRASGFTVSLARSIAPRAHIEEVLKGSGLRKASPIRAVSS